MIHEGYKSKLWLFPLLSSRCFRPILAFVVLGLHIGPVGGKDSSATGLETLDHRPSLLLVTVLIDLLEQHGPSILTVLLVVVEHVALDLLVELVPVVLDLRAGWVVELVLLNAFWNAQSVSPQESPGFSVDLLLHHHLDAVQLEVKVRLDSIDPLEKSQIELVGTSVVGEWKLDENSVLVKLDGQIVLFLNRVRDFDAHLSWCLVPRILKTLRIAENLVFEHVFLPQLDDCTLVQCCLLGLFASLCQLNTHFQEQYNINVDMSQSLRAYESDYTYISEQSRSRLGRKTQHLKGFEVLLGYKNQQCQKAFFVLLMPGSLEITVKQWVFFFFVEEEVSPTLWLRFDLGAEDALSVLPLFSTVDCTKRFLVATLSLQGSKTEKFILEGCTQNTRIP